MNSRTFFSKGKATSVLCLVSGLAIAVQARAGIISNGNFAGLSISLATNAICTTNQAVYPSVDPGAYPACTATGWTGNYQIGNGATVGAFGVSFGIPQPDPGGGNALILQAERNVAPTASQSITLPTEGEYTLSFYAANRSTPSANAGPQTVSALLNDIPIAGGTFSALPAAWTLETVDFYATAGAYSLTLEGLDETTGAAAANVAAFVDDVSLSPGTAVATSTPEPSAAVLVAIGSGLLMRLTRPLRNSRQPEPVKSGHDYELA